MGALPHTAEPALVESTHCRKIKRSVGGGSTPRERAGGQEVEALKQTPGPRGESSWARMT